MLKSTGFKSVVLCVIINAAAGTACAPVPASEAMTIRAGVESEGPVDRTLLVRNVLGGRPTDPMGMPTLGADEFRQALIDSLKSSKLFREVTVGDVGDWRLNCVIISEETKGTWTNIEELMIRYEITDASSGTALLSETVLTSNEMGVSEIFDGGKRRKVLIETTARDNIAEWIRRLREHLATHPELVTWNESDSGKANLLGLSLVDNLPVFFQELD